MRALIQMLAICLFPCVASAQIGGRVVDDQGNPITLASVMLLGPQEILARTRSDVHGNFDLPPISGATGVRVEQFGFGEVTLSLGDITKPLQVVMSPQPFELEGIRAVVPEASCPEEDNPEARKAWNEAISHVHDLSEEDSWGAYVVEWRRSTGLGADFGALRDPSYNWVSYSGTPWGLSLRWAPDNGEDFSLARRRPPGDIGSGPGLAWQIASLYGPAVPLFFKPALALQSTISWGGDGDAIVLCHEDSGGVKTRIAAAIGELGAVHDLVWTLRTSEPVEAAGGQVTFAPPEGGLVLPLPVFSYFWHRENGGRNSQDYRTFSPWMVGEDHIQRLVEYRENMKGQGGTP